MTNSVPTLRQHKLQKYGWLPDYPDHRDTDYKITAPVATPPRVDLTPHDSPLYDQLNLGSCTANAIAAAVQFDRRKQGFKTDFVPSRLFIYYQERLIEGTVNQDLGAMLRDGIKAIAKLGVPPETDWPYNINHFAQKPPAQAYTNALKHTGLSYQRLDNTQINQLKSCLASGYPFVFGFTCYESLETVHVAQTGLLPMPGASEGQIGGHAVMCVGYDDNMLGADGHTKGQFIVRNSWGTAWGQKGYFMMPYAYLTNAKLADDFWQLTVVSG